MLPGGFGDCLPRSVALLAPRGIDKTGDPPEGQRSRLNFPDCADSAACLTFRGVWRCSPRVALIRPVSRPEDQRSRLNCLAVLTRPLPDLLESPDVVEIQ